MANGTVRRKGSSVTTVRGPDLSGTGINVVSPKEQVAHMAEGHGKTSIKGRRKKSKPHSAASTRRGNISSKKPKRAKKTTRSKSVKRRRKNKNG